MCKYAYLVIPKDNRIFDFAIRAVSINCYKIINGMITKDEKKELIYLYKFDKHKKISDLLSVLPFSKWWTFDIDKSLYSKYKHMIYNNGGCVRYNRFSIEIYWDDTAEDYTRISKITKNLKFDLQAEYDQYLYFQEKQRIKNTHLQSKD